jgi:hypothetical protein
MEVEEYEAGKMTKGEADAGKGNQAGQSQVSRFWTLYKLNISVSKPSTQADQPSHPRTAPRDSSES